MYHVGVVHMYAAGLPSLSPLGSPSFTPSCHYDENDRVPSGVVGRCKYCTSVLMIPTLSTQTNFGENFDERVALCVYFLARLIGSFKG